MSFAKNVGKNVSQDVSGKYSQTLLDYAKQSATLALKISSKRVIQKTEEPTGSLVGNKIANRITKVSRSSPQRNTKRKLLMI